MANLEHGLCIKFVLEVKREQGTFGRWFPIVSDVDPKTARDRRCLKVSDWLEARPPPGWDHFEKIFFGPKARGGIFFGVFGGFWVKK